MEQSKILETLGLTFDDVLLLPNFAAFKREDIDVSSYLTESIKLSIPLLSSPMDTVTESSMAIALGNLGGLGVIHRNLTIERQVKEIKIAKVKTSLVGAAVGVGKDLVERSRELVKAGADIIIVDSAHGFSQGVIEA